MFLPKPVKENLPCCFYLPALLSLGLWMLLLNLCLCNHRTISSVSESLLL